MSAAGAKPTLSHLDCVSTAAAARARGRGQRLQLFLCPHHESNHDLTTSAGSASCRKWTLHFAAWHSAVARISAELLPPIFPSTWLLSKRSFCGVESFGHTLHEVLSNLNCVDVWEHLSVTLCQMGGSNPFMSDWLQNITEFFLCQ